MDEDRFGRTIGTHWVHGSYGTFPLVAIGLARLPEHLHTSLLELVESGADGIVYAASAQTAASDEDGGPIGVEPKGTACLFDSGRTLEEGLAHRITGDDNLVGGEETLHAGISYADTTCTVGQFLVGDTRKSVLLMQDIGHVKRSCGLQGCCTGITAHADSGILA